MWILRHDVGRGQETTLSFGVAYDQHAFEHNRLAKACIECIANGS